MEKKNILLTGIGFLFCFNLVVWLEIYTLFSAPGLEVVFFDVGQGDSIFIGIGGRYQVLIDGGPGKKVLEKLTQEMPFWDKTIDLVVLTHPEKDHLEGLIYVLENYEVKNIIWTGVINETKVFFAWQESLEKEKEQGASIKIVQAGEKIMIGEAVFEVLHPLENLGEQRPKDTNKTSLVMRLDFGEADFLFTGDIYKEEELDLIASRADLDADVLKLAHHASKTSTSSEFLQIVTPEVAIACVGENNSYGHPHQEVITRLENLDIILLRTDVNGDIKMESDGTRLLIKKQF